MAMSVLEQRDKLGVQPTVALEIRKQSGQNTVEVADAIGRRLDDLRANLPTNAKLDIVIKEHVTDQLVQITGDATGQIYQLDATFKLVDDHGNVLLQGKGISRAPYNRFQEIFANVRARYDAENRAARTVAESIRTQVAAYLANAA